VAKLSDWLKNRPWSTQERLLDVSKTVSLKDER